ncbi:BamA/TamA family outer membrane protein [Flavisolibacter nicotianae]|uniref:BamA/TamA family outer membrane protein n=1 Tax=Flavisolibacter nicotianae TaxID=2364882 RepID=UPI000EB46A13|nr:BamA/TamA family outer membrane protein [Flavisolibacter nicotianae]
MKRILHPESFYRSQCFLLVFFFVLFSLPAVAQQNPPFETRVVAIAPSYDSVGSFHRFWLGTGYRKIWAAPVPLKILYLGKEKGGLTPLELGGGFQTRSLRLRDASSKQWVLRSVQKYPERRLPDYLRNTIAQRILQDQVVTVHPFGALTVPTFANALGLVHTNPQIVYVADDPALGQYRSEFGNGVFLFEERGAIDTFRTINTEQVQMEVETDNRSRINQRMVLRARLLDFLLGDWDRHEGQWRWEARKQGGEIIFSPVPFDRDYVFYNTSGVLPWLVSQQYQNSRFQGFDNHIRNIAIYNFNNRYFDRYFLTALTANEWNEEIEFVQKKLTDDVLETAVRQMPENVYALTGQHIIETLKNRRNNLKEDALTYYRFLANTVDIPATAGPEQVAVEHKPGGNVLVTIASAGNAEAVLYRREFDPAVTKEIRLYGLGGDDSFRVEGSESSPIKVRMIGGDGNDHFEVNAGDPNKHRLLIYDRSDQENSYAGPALIRTAADTNVNRFDRRSFRYNRSMPFFSLFYNIDQRAMMSLGWIWQKNGFRKEPYASRHQLVGGYSPSRGSFAFSYEADWRHVFGKSGLNFKIVSVGPRNLQNFFGTGNETYFPAGNNNGKNILYYRNLIDIVHADLRVKRYMTQHIAWSAGLAAQYYYSSPDNNKSRFLSEYNRTHPDEKVFTNRVHAGIGAGLEVDTRRNSLLPANGIHWITDLRAMTQLRGDSRTFGALQTDLSFYTRLRKDSGIVLVNRVGAGTTAGDPLFYQMMQLGGMRMLRGFNTSRFTGRSMLFHNAELRVKLFDFTSYLFPGSFGIVGFNDVGRVWMPNESSTKWHDGYGGGIYILPANVLLIRAMVGHSEETTQFYFNFLFGL